MLIVLFIILMIVVFGNIIRFCVRVAWTVRNIILLLMLPFSLLISLAMLGLVTVALLILMVIGIVMLIG